jgi:hypothetical protein
VRHQACNRLVLAVDDRVARHTQDHVRHGKAYVEEIGRQVERQRIERYQAVAQPLQGPHVFERRRAKARQIVGPLIEAVKAPVGDNRRIVVGALAT